MKIGIVGSGNIGATAARLFARAGHEVAVSNSRGGAGLESLVAELGGKGRATGIEEAARFGEVVLVAVPFGKYETLPAEAFEGKIVIDANNYYPQRDGQFERLDGGASDRRDRVRRRGHGPARRRRAAPAGRHGRLQQGAERARGRGGLGGRLKNFLNTLTEELMTTLFDPLRVGEIELDNRIVMAPMTRSRADDRGVQPAFVAEYYRQRASAGLIITEATNISPLAKGYVRTPGIYTPEQLESWRPVAEAVHARGGKVFMQIFHTGRIALPDLLPEGARPVAPSAVRAQGQNYTDEGMKEFVTPREITREEIAQTVRDFAAAAANAVAA